MLRRILLVCVWILGVDNGFYHHHEGALKILTYMTLID